MCYVEHLDCLRYAIEHGCPLNDNILTTAVDRGRLASVKLLVSGGLPKWPYMLEYNGPTQEPLRPEQLQCMQYLLDNQRVIQPRTLVCAAMRGDLGAVRFLHDRGVQLWTAAWEAERGDGEHQSTVDRRVFQTLAFTTGTIAIPQMPQDAAHMWRALQYGWVMGAPLTPAMADVFKSKRAATRATLLCFHVAARMSQGTGSLSQGTGSLSQGTASLGQGTGSLTQGTGSLSDEEGTSRRAVWAGMGRVPIELLEKILVYAGFEIYESLRRSAPRGGLVHVHCVHPLVDDIMVWVRSDAV